MTDKIMLPPITADEYRAAAKVGRTRGLVHQIVEDWEAEAARLEAESARDEEAEKLAEVYRVAFNAAAGDSYIADGSWAVAGIRAVLDRLAADGRLLPEGGVDAAQERLRRNPETIARVQKAQSERDQAVRVEVTPPAVSVPDDAPDGTPEKPWPTWQDVPEGVRYCSRKQRHHRWVNRNGERFTVAFSNDNEHPAVADEKTMKLRAPFVRVDGGQA